MGQHENPELKSQHRSYMLNSAFNRDSGRADKTCNRMAAFALPLPVPG
jgi:hypothetical protein